MLSSFIFVTAISSLAECAFSELVVGWEIYEFYFVSRKLIHASVKKAKHFGKGLESIYSKVLILHSLQ